MTWVIPFWKGVSLSHIPHKGTSPHGAMTANRPLIGSERAALDVGYPILERCEFRKTKDSLAISGRLARAVPHPPQGNKPTRFAMTANRPLIGSERAALDVGYPILERCWRALAGPVSIGP